MPIDSISYFNLKRSTASESGPWTIIQVLNQQTVTATNPFTVPAKGSDVTVVVADVSWVSVNQYVNVALAGLFKVVGKDTANSSLALRYLNETYNTRSGNVIPVGSQVLPGSYEDSFAPSPKVWYLLEGITANGITITYNVVSVEGAPPSGPGTVIWVQAWSGTAADSNDRVNGSATDVFGNTYVVGDFASGFHVRKYNSSGALLWERTYSGSGQGVGVTTDPSGNAYVVGFSIGTFIPGEGLPNVNGTGAYQMPIVLKYAPDATGTTQWCRGFPSEAGGDALFTAVAYYHNPVTPKLWITGAAVGQHNFGGGVIGPGNILLRLNASDGSYGGVGRMMINRGGAVGGPGGGIGLDTSENVYLTGQFANTFIVGNGIPDLTAGGVSMFVAKFNSAGLCQWARGLSTDSKIDRGNGVAVDSANNAVYFVGMQSGDNFDAGNGVTLPERLPENSDQRGYLLKMNLNGVAQWVKQFAGASGFNDSANSVAVHTNGDVVVGGKINGAFDYGGGSVGAQGNDGFTVKYDLNGTFKWVKVFGNFSNDGVNAVSMDTSGNVYSAVIWYGASFSPTDLGDGIPRVSTLNDGGLIKYSA